MPLPPVEERTFTAMYERVLAKRPDEIAQIDRHGSYTFAQSFARASRIAGGLRALGVGRQEPIGILMDNSLDAVHVWSGVSLGGNIEVPVNSAYKGRFLSHVLNDSGARVLVVDDAYLERVAAVAGDLTALETIVVRGRAADAARSPALARMRLVPFGELETASAVSPARVSHADLMAFMYTSGTTGASKGVMVPHAHAYTYASREDLPRPHHGDRLLVTLPIFHLAGQWYGVYQALIHQVRCVLEPSFSVSRFWDVIREQGITYTTMLGAMSELLQQQPPRADDAENPLELAVMAPLASDAAGFKKRFGVELFAVYGMSEIGVVLNGPPETIVGGEAGFPRPGYELRLVDGEGKDVATGVTGELWVRPEHPSLVMAGYHNLPEKTADTLKDGWVHTGDAFRKDEAGRWFFTDRMKDALRRRGENVSSFEVERTINEFPDVLESAVVAAPSAIGEDEIKAVIVAREGKTVDPVALTRFLIDRMPYFMVPRYLDFVSELPKTPTHKVHKHLLRDRGVGAGVWDREAAGIVLRRGS